MVQIGNIHIGKADSARETSVGTAEAFFLWDQLVSRYDIIQSTQIYQNFAKDPEFKQLLTSGLGSILEKQVNQVEQQMNLFKLVLPPRPPKSVDVRADSELMEDEFLFKQVFTGIQLFLDMHARAIRSCIHNDSVRTMFIEFALEEFNIFDRICKYGKLKGWVQVPPLKY